MFNDETTYNIHSFLAGDKRKNFLDAVESYFIKPANKRKDTLVDKCVEMFECEKESYQKYLDLITVFRVPLSVKHVTTGEILTAMQAKAGSIGKSDYIVKEYTYTSQQFRDECTAEFKKLGEDKFMGRPADWRKFIYRQYFAKFDDELFKYMQFLYADSIIIFDKDFEAYRDGTTLDKKYKKTHMYALVCVPSDPAQVKYTKIILGHNFNNSELLFRPSAWYSIYKPFAYDLKKETGTVLTLQFQHMFTSVFAGKQELLYKNRITLQEEVLFFPEKLQETEKGSKYPKLLDKIFKHLDTIICDTEDVQASNYFSKLYTALEQQLRHDVKIKETETLEDQNPGIKEVSKEVQKNKLEQYLAKRSRYQMSVADEEVKQQQSPNKRQKTDQQQQQQQTHTEDELDDEMDEALGDMEEGPKVNKQNYEEMSEVDEDDLKVIKVVEPEQKPSTKKGTKQSTTKTMAAQIKLEQKQQEINSNDIPAARTKNAKRQQ